MKPAVYLKSGSNSSPSLIAPALLLLSISLCCLPAQATDSVKDTSIATIKSGRAKAQGCTRCHGRKGIRRAAVRSGFEGSTGAFARRELLAFRKGSRQHAIMSGVAKSLTDEDIRDISAWLDSVD